MDFDVNIGVSQGVISDFLGISRTQVNNLAADGVFHPVGSPRKYPLRDTVRAYEDYKNRQRNEKRQDDQDIDAQKRKADALYKTTKAAEARLSLAELEGKMHRSEDVQAAFEQLVYGIRSMLLALPGRAAIDVVGAANAAEAADIIRREVFEILSALSQFEYDPEFFSKRVRDRKGWSGTIDKLSEEGEEPQQRDSRRDRSV